MLNADDPASLALASAVRAQRLLFSLHGSIADGIVTSATHIVRRAEGVERPLVPLRSIRLLGPHLVADVLAAAAVAWLAGVTPEAMTRAVEGFTGLEHALEPVTEIGGVRFVNDSKATNVEAARRAIESFGAGLVAIMGGRFKGGDLADLVDAVEGARRHGHRDRRGAAAASRGARRRPSPCVTPPTCAPPCGPRSGSRRRAAWSCSLRRARASTCSATTPSAGVCSSKRRCSSGGSGTTRVSSE